MSNYTQNEFREISAAAERCLKNPTSTMALRRFCEKLRELQNRWAEFKTRYEEIVKSHQLLIKKYEDEHAKCKSYKGQLRRIKENHENVVALKEVYENIKRLEKVMYTEVEIQTDERADDLVNKESLTAARDTLESIKVMVAQREERLDENLKMISAMNERISSLEKQNFELYILLRKRDLGEEIRIDENPRRTDRLSMVNLPMPEVKATYIPTPNVKLKRPPLASRGRPNKSNATSLSYNPLSSTATRTSLERGDCKGVMTLKKIRTELDRKQATLKEKIDRFNLRLGT